MNLFSPLENKAQMIASDDFARIIALIPSVSSAAVAAIKEDREAQKRMADIQAARPAGRGA